MRVAELILAIPNCRVYGSQELSLTGITADSQAVVPGYLFIAKKGNTVDGSAFVPAAIQAGAIAILSDHYDPTIAVTQIVHDSPATIEAFVAATFYRHPSRQLLAIGITGTNGKTTTSYIVKHLLESLKGSCGLIGSIAHLCGQQRWPASHTTPDVCTNQRLIRRMVDEGCTSVVMEVSSHALMQKRVENIAFDVAVFTNLTPEHLDYHRTMEAYCQAKNRLFNGFGGNSSQWAIVNKDDPYHLAVTQGCMAPVTTYSIDQEADLKAVKMTLTENGTNATLLYQGRLVDFFWPLAGRYNVYNCLAALSVLLTQGYSLDMLVNPMAALPPVSGRLEAVPNPLNLKVYVDHAHKPDALEKVLMTLTEFKKGKIFTVFGCGGERDNEKRAKMAAIAEMYGDHTFVTNDNPRSENPLKIIEMIQKGFKKNSYTVEPDREKAIRLAIERASPEDIILIAGKGHEDYQIFADFTVDFSDRKAAGEICSEIFLKRNTCD